MQHLKDVRVDIVSLVDRAAVRDPQRKSEPRRFVLTKRDAGDDAAINKKGADMSATKTEGLEALSKDERAVYDALLEKMGGASEKVDGERFPGDGDLDDERNDKTLKNKGDAGHEAGSDGPGKGGGLTDSGSEATKSEGVPAGLSKAEFDGLPEAAKAALLKSEQTSSTLAAELAKSDQKAAEALEIAKQERTLRETSEFIAKAETDYPVLSVTPSEFGPVLKRASEKLDKADFEALETVLKGANEAVQSSMLMREQGRGGEVQKASDPERQLLAKADEIRKADTSLTASAAFLQAVSENPDLARGYEAAR